MKTSRVFLDIEKQFDDVIREYRGTQFKAIQEALTVAAQYLVKQLEAASPIGKGPDHFRNHWDIETKYINVRYVGNTKMTKETKNYRSVPLSQMLEYSKNKVPFIEMTWERNKNAVFNIFKKELERRI